MESEAWFSQTSDKHKWQKNKSPNHKDTKTESLCFLSAKNKVQAQ